jgi:hypothetical protein
MKKVLLIGILLLSVFSGKHASAQVWPCEPSPELTWNGIYPENLPNAMAGVLYWTSLSFQIPQDSIINPGNIAVTIDSVKFLYASGKPPGFDFICNTPTCAWPGGGRGCALFYGQVDTGFTDSVSEYPMKIYTRTWFRFTGGTDQLDRIDSATNYAFKIVKYNGLAEFSQYTTLKAYPNPTTGLVTIELRDIKDNANEVSIMDAFGKVVYTEKFDKPSQFLSTYTADLSGYTPGLYIVTLKSGDKVGLSKIMLR